MKYTNRFHRIAQLLFTSQISDEDTFMARQVVDLLDKIELDIQQWLDTIEKNLNVFNEYHGKEKALVIISEVFEKTQTKIKEKYERMILTIKEAINAINKIQDVEMQDMVKNLTKTSEEFTQLYNEMTSLPIKIGEPGFIQQFKDLSQALLDNHDPLLDIIGRIKDYVLKNILGEQALS